MPVEMRDRSSWRSLSCLKIAGYVPTLHLMEQHVQIKFAEISGHCADPATNAWHNLVQSTVLRQYIAFGHSDPSRNHATPGLIGRPLRRSLGIQCTCFMMNVIQYWHTCQFPLAKRNCLHQNPKQHKQPWCIMSTRFCTHPAQYPTTNGSLAWATLQVCRQCGRVLCTFCSTCNVSQLAAQAWANHGNICIPTSKKLICVENVWPALQTCVWALLWALPLLVTFFVEARNRSAWSWGPHAASMQWCCKVTRFLFWPLVVFPQHRFPYKW